MGVEGGVSGSTGEILSVSEWDVLSVGTLVAFGETEIDNENCVFVIFSSSNQEIVWFDVSVDDSLLMNHFDSLDHLDGNMEDSLEIELSSALLEQIFEGLA